MLPPNASIATPTLNVNSPTRKCSPDPVVVVVEDLANQASATPSSTPSAPITTPTLYVNSPTLVIECFPDHIHGA